MISAILALVIFVFFAKKPNQARIILGGERINVAIADTVALQEKGLSGHKPLAANEGMLFVFAESGSYGFWMKDMLFPIDIIWFDSDRRVVDVWERADPRSYPKIFTPRAPARFVLEVSAGFFADHHLETGNILEIPR